MSRRGNDTDVDFVSFRKIPRLFKDIVITEKIDGTNGQLYIHDGIIQVGSRNRWLTPESDNFGFCKWVEQNKEELLTLGDGRHYGEWYGLGIQRGYGLKEKKFMLFNRGLEIYPDCCEISTKLYEGEFSTEQIECVMEGLATYGSGHVPGFMKPEGIVIFHQASGTLFKHTFEAKK